MELTHTVGEYRNINKTYRNTPVPKYFSNDDAKKLYDSIIDSGEVFRGYCISDFDKDEIQEKQ